MRTATVVGLTVIALSLITPVGANSIVSVNQLSTPA